MIRQLNSINLYQEFLNITGIQELIIDPIKNKFQRLVMSWLQVTILFFLFYCFSLLIYYIVFQRLTPTPAIRQTIYFDYTFEQPKAIITLTALQKQWIHLKTKQQLVNSGIRALKSGALYDIEAFVTLSKSPRNIDLGKVAITTTIIDNTAEAIAKSVRPIMIPYYTDTYLFLETIFTFPTIFFGFPSVADSSQVFLNIMKDYQEPYFSYPGSEVIELILSNAVFDLIELELMIIPQLNFFTYWLFHYPKFSFMIGFCTISVLALTGYLFVCFLVIVFTFSISESTEREMKQAAEALSGFDGLMDEVAVTQMHIEMEREQQRREQRFQHQQIQQQQQQNQSETTAEPYVNESERAASLSFYFPTMATCDNGDANETKE